MTARVDSPAPPSASPPPRPAAAIADARLSLPSRRGDGSVVQWILVGARGQVGSALREQCAALAPGLARDGLALRLRAAFDRRGFAAAAAGLDPRALDGAWLARSAGDWSRLRARLAGEAVPTVIVDCTASDAVAAGYEDWLAAGCGIVTANKLANAGSLARWRRLHALAAAHGSPYHYETTVGAALPLLGSVRALVARGEAPTRFEAVLSGSLSYLLAQVQRGLSFSAAVAQAQALGLTEPDPREDLECRDLVRKLLILARSAGAGLEPSQVEVEPLVDAAAPRIEAADARWDARVRQAQARGRRLAVVAEFEHGRGRIGVRALAPEHPLARLAPGENLVRLWTPVHAQVPIAIGGPGAGPEVTAAGVLGDVLEAARALQARAARA